MILITGANGQLGQSLKSIYSRQDLVYLDKNSCDISHFDQLRSQIKKYMPKVVINCAAFTNVDKCEQESELAYRVNSTGPKNLALLSKEFNFTIIHISTDYVFDGEKNTPYGEDDQTCPISVYGKSKLMGETGITENTDNYIIIRTSWLYSEFSLNFVKKIKKLMESSEALGIVYDQIGSPTYALDLARAIMHIITTENLSKTGIYHFSNSGVSSWYDLATVTKNYFSINCKISPIESFSYPTPARRPHYTVFNTRKFQDSFKYEIPYWASSLNICLKKL